MFVYTVLCLYTLAPMFVHTDICLYILVPMCVYTDTSLYVLTPNRQAEPAPRPQSPPCTCHITPPDHHLRARERRPSIEHIARPPPPLADRASPLSPTTTVCAWSPLPLALVNGRQAEPGGTTSSKSSLYLPERDFVIDNLLVRIHLIRWTGLAPWSLNCLFQVAVYLLS